MRRTSLICIVVMSMNGSVGATGNKVGRQTHGGQIIAARLPAAFDWGPPSTGPLCGVYAACRALAMIGIDANPRDYLAARYIGQCSGSTPAELSSIITDAGAHAFVLTRLSGLDLRLIGCPIIANVRADPTNNRFNHWVVALPSEEGVTIYDGLQQPYNIRTSEFLGSWSGIGVCVARSDSGPLALIWLGRSSLFLAALIAGVLVLRNRADNSTCRRSALNQIAALLVASLILSAAGNVAFGDLRYHRKGLAVATASNVAGKHHIGTLEDIERTSVSRNVLLVDARMEQDYKLGTIHGAVNIPVNASIWKIQQYLERLDRDTPIVVFCQSARCDYDQFVANQIGAIGFSDVTVCNQGWAEYTKAKSGAGID